MLYRCLIVMLYSCWGVIQDGQQITANVADFGGVIAHTFQHILDVRLLQCGKALLDNLAFELRSTNAEGCLAAAKHIGDEFYQLVHGFTVMPGESDVADILLNLRFAFFRTPDFGFSEVKTSDDGLTSEKPKS